MTVRSANNANAKYRIGASGKRLSKVTEGFLTANLNWWGNGNDGALDVGSNAQNAILSNTLDGDVVVRNYSYLRIRPGYTLTTQYRCRGLAVYVDGDCLIEGTINMTARGAYTPNLLSEVGVNGLRFVRRKSGQSQILSASDMAGCGAALITSEASQNGIDGNGKIYQIPRLGGAGAAGKNSGVPLAGNTGGSITMGTGGGGSGSSMGSISGAGGYGSCFSGGSGSGGWATNNGSSGPSINSYGCPGGNGAADYGHNAGGGAGNPGGVSASGGDSPVGAPAESGTGGTLILFVRGTLTVASSGVVQANGNVGGAGGPTSSGTSGGGSGGGLIMVLYGGAYSSAGSFQANGGAGGVRSAGSGAVGGAGGAGYILVERVDV